MMRAAAESAPPMQYTKKYHEDRIRQSIIADRMLTQKALQPPPTFGTSSSSTEIRRTPYHWNHVRIQTISFTVENE